MDSCSNIDLNLELSIKQSNPNLPADQKEGDMMEVIISKIYSDNRKIRRMVAGIFQKYSSMHSIMMQHLITNNKDVISDGNSNNTLQIRKRKFSAIEDNEMMSCCSRGNEERLRMMNSKPKVSTVFVRVDPLDSSLAVKDGYQWRKYGQKVTRDNPSPRAYFKCSFAPLCLVKKKVQKSVEDPTVLVLTYEGEHNHKKPSSHGSNFTPTNIIPRSSLINLSPSRNHISSSDHLNRQHLSDNEPKKKRSEEDNIIADERDQEDWIL